MWVIWMLTHEERNTVILNRERKRIRIKQFYKCYNVAEKPGNSQLDTPILANVFLELWEL